MPPKYNKLNRMSADQLEKDMQVLRNPDMYLTARVGYSSWPHKANAHVDARLQAAINTALLALSHERDGKVMLNYAKKQPVSPCCHVLMKFDCINFDDYEKATTPDIRKELFDAAFEDLFEQVRSEYNDAWNHRVTIDFTQSHHFAIQPILDNADFSVPADKLPQEIWKHSVENTRFIIGRTHPDLLIQTAQVWNDWYESEYARLLAGIASQTDFCKDDVNLLERLRLAIGGLTETPDPWSPLLTLLKPMHFTFGTLIDDESLQDMTAHPENYALIPVVPKLVTD